MSKTKRIIAAVTAAIITATSASLMSVFADNGEVKKADSITATKADNTKSSLQEYADDISTYMMENSIAGDAFVHDNKIVVTYSAHEDKIKAYIKEKGIDENLVFYEKGRNQEDITDDEKEAALKEYAADISNFMIKSDIAGDAFVHDGKVVVTFSAYEDKIKAYVKEKGIDENIVVYEKGQDQNTKGDANCDGQVDLSDAVMIMQALANPNKYGIDGTAEHHLTEQGKLNGDMNGDGLTVGDAQSIQRKLLGLDDTLTIQTPPATNSYSYESYSDLNEALIKQDSSILVDSNNYGELFNKTVSAFGNKDIDLYVPAIDGKACDLRNKEGFSNISLMTAELYNLPWIWYHCKVNNIDVDVKLAYHSVIESSELNSAKNYYEVLKVIAPDAPNPDNYAKFESYQKIYESEITIANGEKVVAMISEIANSSNVYVMFVYEGKLVSIYANKDDLSESFLSSFSLEKI